ncbi:MAG: hypothetical protein HQL10_02355 [Nitrospirae bacterium]|nr:hypothetical protein [Nitrospirota bacterium]
MLQKFIAFMIVPLLLLPLGYYLSKKINVGTSLAPAEKSVQSFKQDDVKVVAQEIAADAKNIQSPIELKIPEKKVAEKKGSKKSYPKDSLAAITAQADKIKEPVEEVIKLNLTLTRQDKKMAVINGNLVQEGGQFQDTKVEKIERNKVLLKDKKGEKWLIME